MEVVFWDYINADVYVTDHVVKDTSRNAAVESVLLQKKIFKKHKITREEFYKSYAYYVDHPDMMKMTIDSMLQKQRKNVIPKKSNNRTRYE